MRAGCARVGSVFRLWMPHVLCRPYSHALSSLHATRLCFGSHPDLLVGYSWVGVGSGLAGESGPVFVARELLLDGDATRHLSIEYHCGCAPIVVLIYTITNTYDAHATWAGDPATPPHLNKSQAFEECITAIASSPCPVYNICYHHACLPLQAPPYTHHCSTRHHTRSRTPTSPRHHSPALILPRHHATWAALPTAARTQHKTAPAGTHWQQAGRQHVART